MKNRFSTVEIIIPFSERTQSWRRSLGCEQIASRHINAVGAVVEVEVVHVGRAQMVCRI
jgi:hypothetical protein